MNQSNETHFTRVEIPPINEEERRLIRQEAGLVEYIGTGPRHDVVTMPNYAHATNEYIQHVPNQNLHRYIGGTPPAAPTGGTARRRPKGQAIAQRDYEGSMGSGAPRNPLKVPGVVHK